MYIIGVPKQEEIQMSSLADAKMVANATGRKVIKTVEFSKGDVFEAYHDAEELLKMTGYSVGSMCYQDPTVAAIGDMYVAKWRNIGSDEWRKIQAMIVGKDFRDSGVTVCFIG
jgi:hypothetical protein